MTDRRERSLSTLRVMNLPRLCSLSLIAQALWATTCHTSRRASPLEAVTSSVVETSAAGATQPGASVTLGRDTHEPSPVGAVSVSQSGQPGIFINVDPVADRCRRSTCVPLCQDPKTEPNAQFPDWGWENDRSCVINDSPTALVAGGDRALAVRNHGYAVAPRPCRVGGDPVPDFSRAPPLNKKSMSTPSFVTRGAQLIDVYGQPFLPRAVNNAHGWYDICAQYSALEALDNIAATGANAVRIGWAFDSIDPGGPDEGPPSQRVIGTSPELLAEILHRAVELHLIPILTFNDSTGQTDPAWVDRMVTKITSPAYLAVFKAYEAYLLLGLANELNVAFEHYAPAYIPAIRKLRARGYRGTLVVTANEWGQGCETLLAFGPLLVSSDPQHNLLFDLHMYTYVHYRHAAAPNQFAGGEPERIAACLDEVAELELPLLIGEFGKAHSSGPVAWEVIVERANANGQGYAPWLWYGDTEYPALNMSQTWEGPLTEWGREATADFAKSSRPASIFQSTRATAP